MSSKFVACIGKGGQRDMAESFARRTGTTLLDKPGEELTVLFDAKGVSLIGYGLSYQGDFEGMLHRVSDGRLAHEMLVRAAKTTQTNVKGIDATAGMGEDAFLLAACGYEMTLYEQNPVVAVLLKDALRRAKKHPKLKDIAARMQLVENNSVDELKSRVDDIDLIYLDPMFPSKKRAFQRAFYNDLGRLCLNRRLKQFDLIRTRWFKFLDQLQLFIDQSRFLLGKIQPMN